MVNVTDHPQQEAAFVTTWRALAAELVSSPQPPECTAASGSAGEQLLFRTRLENAVDLLLLSCRIRAIHRATRKVTLFRMCEVEIYANASKVHEDTFTHGDPQQETVGTWYFHKKGGTFKSGSFKGLDVTFGAPKLPVGFLIRSVLPLKSPDASDTATLRKEDLVEGPSLVVDTLLAALGVSSILDLVGGRDACLPIHHPMFSLERASASVKGGVVKTDEVDHAPARPGMTMCVGCGPRVGLVPRTTKDLLFAGRYYRRYLRLPSRAQASSASKGNGSGVLMCPLAKLRAGIVSACLLPCLPLPPPSPEAATGSSPASIQSRRDFILQDVAAATGATARLVADVDATSKLAAGVAVGTDAAAELAFLKEHVLGQDVTKTTVIAALVGFCHTKGWS